MAFFWDQCIICQKISETPLKCPLNANTTDIEHREVYKNFLENAAEFQSQSYLLSVGIHANRHRTFIPMFSFYVSFYYFCPFRTVCNIVWVSSDPHAPVQPWRGWHQNCNSCVTCPTVRLYKCSYTDTRHRRCRYCGGKVWPTDRREIGCRHLDCLWNEKALPFH